MSETLTERTGEHAAVGLEFLHAQAQTTAAIEKFEASAMRRDALVGQLLNRLLSEAQAEQRANELHKKSSSQSRRSQKRRRKARTT